MYPRKIRQSATEALADSPVVLVVGARQTGKSTLVKDLQHEARYLTFDTPAALAAAQGDPFGFIAAQEGPVCLDEVQRAPEVFLAIKSAVDQNRIPGRFLLTGSANVLLLPKIADSLAGRMEVLTLWPLSQSEVEYQSTSLVDSFFGGQLPAQIPFERGNFIERLVAGGYPEALARASGRRRESWFDNYLNTILLRDVRDLAHIEGLTELPRLMQLLAARSGGLFNAAELSRATGVPQTTLKRYLTLLETLFLIRRVPAWSSNLGKRLQKSPKLFLSDYGLMAHLQGLGREGLEAALGLPGALVEAFVFAEVAKHQSWAEMRTALMHYRTSTGVEVDFVLENRRSELVGIEVKAASTVVSKDFNGLRHLRETVPRQFKRGIVLYAGDQVVHFDEQLTAVPLSIFWAGGSGIG